MTCDLPACPTRACGSGGAQLERVAGRTSPAPRAPAAPAGSRSLAKRPSGRILCLLGTSALRSPAVVAALSNPAASGQRAGQPPTGPVKLVCFRLHGQEYAAPIADIKETMTVRPITRVFLTPPWLAGIINLRGDIVPVIDLAQLMGLPATVITGDSRIIICQPRQSVSSAASSSSSSAASTASSPGGAAAPAGKAAPSAASIVAGLVVDQMAELRTLDLAALQPPPPTLSGDAATLLLGIATVDKGAPLRVLSLRHLFETERLRAFQRKEA